MEACFRLVSSLEIQQQEQQEKQQEKGCLMVMANSLDFGLVVKTLVVCYRCYEAILKKSINKGHFEKEKYTVLKQMLNF